MSDMYAIKGSTLTAIGDAIRSKTSKYISVEEKGEPIHRITGYTTDLEFVGYDSMSNRNWYIAPIDFRVMDIIEDAPKWYVEYSFESLDVAGPVDSRIKFLQNDTYTTAELFDSYRIISLCFLSKGSPTANGNISGTVLDVYKMAYLMVGMRPTEDEQGQRVSYDIKIWPQDNSNKFIIKNTYTPLQMADKINGLKIIPSSATAITGDCQYKFSANGWNWFIDAISDEIKTNDVSSCYYMFYNANTLTHIPFDINIAKGLLTVSHCFDGCKKLEEVPYIIGPADKALPTSSYSGCITLDHLFQYCEFLRYIPDDYFWKIIPNEAYWVKWRELSSQACNGLFQNCYSLRKLPDISMLGANEGYYSALYSSLCYQCFSLDEIIDLPVSNASYTSNAFGDVVRYCYRLKDFIFATNEDGTAKTAKWKSQTIDLSGAGFGYHPKVHIYNSGITEDKEVKDDATYQALKNDPNWFTLDINYSRYNHDSAVNTINSLPDCSATGTNTIKFKGASGALTDGGAINTLTEAEIAVAAAKGWSVALV